MTDHLTQAQATGLLDRLKAVGFTSGIDCSAPCVDGYYSQRSRRWGEPKSDRFAVSFTPLAEMIDPAWEALGKPRSFVVRGGTYWIYEWEEAFDA